MGLVEQHITLICLLLTSKGCIHLSVYALAIKPLLLLGIILQPSFIYPLDELPVDAHIKI